MEITEKHLEDEFIRLEVYALNIESEEQRQGIIFAAASMKMRLEVVLKAKSEEDLKLGEEFGKEVVRILEETGELLSYKYRCGHGIKCVILNTTIDSLATYMEWKNSGGGLCLECWLNERKKDEKKEE